MNEREWQEYAEQMEYEQHLALQAQNDWNHAFDHVMEAFWDDNVDVTGGASFLGVSEERFEELALEWIS